MRSSVSDRPNRAVAFFASGFTSFIWTSNAPTISTGDTPPISVVIGSEQGIQEYGIKEN
jgi:hypothetical protein